MVMPSFYKKPRYNLATRLEATFGKTGVKQVYEARKVAPLEPRSSTPRVDGARSLTETQPLGIRSRST